jgi:hypothetical protein
MYKHPEINYQPQHPDLEFKLTGPKFEPAASLSGPCGIMGTKKKCEAKKKADAKKKLVKIRNENWAKLINDGLNDLGLQRFLSAKDNKYSSKWWNQVGNEVEYKWNTMWVSKKSWLEYAKEYAKGHLKIAPPA